MAWPCASSINRMREPCITKGGRGPMTSSASSRQRITCSIRVVILVASVSATSARPFKANVDELSVGSKPLALILGHGRGRHGANLGQSAGSAGDAAGFAQEVAVNRHVDGLLTASAADGDFSAGRGLSVQGLLHGFRSPYLYITISF